MKYNKFSESLKSIFVLTGMFSWLIIQMIACVPYLPESESYKKFDQSIHGPLDISLSELQSIDTTSASNYDYYWAMINYYGIINSQAASLLEVRANHNLEGTFSTWAIGNLHYIKGNKDSALFYFEKSYALDESHSNKWNATDLFNSRFEMEGIYDVMLLYQALEIDPIFYPAVESLLSVPDSIFSFEDKLNRIDEIVGLDSNYILNAIIGEFYLFSDSSRKAEFYFRRSLYKQDNAFALRGIGMIYQLYFHDFDSALQYYSSSFRLDNQNFETAYVLACLYYNSDNLDSAKKWFIVQAELENSWHSMEDLLHFNFLSDDCAEVFRLLKEHEALFSDSLSSVIRDSYLYLCGQKLVGFDTNLQFHDFSEKYGDAWLMKLQALLDDYQRNISDKCFRCEE